MSELIGRRLSTWTAPATIGLIVGALCAGMALEVVRTPLPMSAPVGADTTSDPSGPGVANTYRDFDVPVALIEPESAARVITTRTTLRWTTAGGDVIEVLAGEEDDPFAPHWGTTVTDRGTRTVAGARASIGTVFPRRPVRAEEVRIAVFRLGDRPIRVIARTNAAAPDVRVLADFEIVLDSLRVLDR